MFKFGVMEYVRNIWYNILTILILTASFLVCITFVSNINSATKLYRLVDPYMNEDSIIMGRRVYMDIDSLAKVDKVLMTKEIFCISNKLRDMAFCVVYNDEAMSIMPPRLSEGKKIKQVKADENTLVAYISENSSGLGTGDRFKITCFDYDNNDAAVEIEVLIAGIISDGQKLFKGSGKFGSDMGYEDLYETYSYEQLGQVVIITTEEEINKFDKNLSLENANVIIKFDDDITEEERKNNLRLIKAHEEKYSSVSVTFYPSTKLFCDRKEEGFRNLLLTYIPLTTAVFILLVTSIIGIVFIKTATHMRYYTTLYICGMPYNRAVIITGFEMGFNCMMSLMSAIALIILQNEFNFVGKINAELDMMQISVVVIMCVLVTVISMWMAKSVIKEKTPVQILKDTAY